MLHNISTMKFGLCLIVSLLFVPVTILTATNSNTSIETKRTDCPGNDPKIADSVAVLLNGCLLADMSFGTLIENAREMMTSFPHGTAAGTVIEVYLYQAFSFFNEEDSTAKYAMLASQGIEDVPILHVQIIFYNSMGMNAMVNDLNYASALHWFELGVKTAEKSGIGIYAITPLANICQIYYMRKDPAGMKYAERVYEIMSYDATNKTNAYYKALSCIMMAQMSVLCSKYTAAEQYLLEAKDIVSAFGIKSHNTHIAVIDADLKMAKNDLNGALQSLEDGLSYEQYAESGIQAMMYLRYGNVLEQAGRYTEAFQMFDNGLKMLGKTGSLEFKPDLLEAKSDILFKMGKYKESAQTSSEYNDMMLKIVSVKDREFESEIDRRMMVENENRILQQDLAISKLHKKVTLMIFIFVMMLAAVFVMLLLYRHKLQLYKISLQKINMTQEKLVKLPENFSMSSTGNNTDDTIKDIYTRLEKLMAEGYYRNKDINMDSIAEKLGTNRTYVSKAVNRYSGLSLWGLINNYRISEALKTIDNEKQDVVFKNLADELGFSSLPVFSRAFSKAVGIAPTDYLKKVCKS